MKAFLTGRRVYGTPNEDSDVDLVIRVESDVAFKIIALLSESGGDVVDVSGEDNCVPSVKVGKLNLIFATSDLEYEIWSRGTEQLLGLSQISGPMNRSECIAFFDKLRAKISPKQLNDDPYEGL